MAHVSLFIIFFSHSFNVLDIKNDKNNQQNNVNTHNVASKRI